MKKTKLLLILSIAITLRVTAAANPCDVKKLPQQIQSSLAKDYADWNIVTPNTLEASDRATWDEDYANECPGLIKGKFSGEREGYTLNLVKKLRGKTLQQIAYFEPSDRGFRPVVIFPCTAITIVTVIRTFAPGKYQSFSGDKSLLIKTDTIGVSKIDAWTAVYYWDGSRFRQIVTSD